MDPWLARLRHDLLKPVLWRARDLADSGQAPGIGDLIAFRRALLELADDGGEPTTAARWWRRQQKQAPPALKGPALEAFGLALEAAERAVGSDDPVAALDAVRRLEAAFQRLEDHAR